MGPRPNNRFAALNESDPQGGKGGSGRRNRNRGGNNSHKRIIKFVGQDKGSMEGIVISETHPTPPAQQYDAFINALIVHGGSINPQVKTALKNLTPVTEKSMEPPLPDTSSYKDSKGNVDKTVTDALMTVWTAKASRASKLFSVYEQDLKALFSTVWGQLSTGIQENLKGFKEWETIDNDNDTIALMLKLRDLCYKDNNHKIAPPLDLIKKTQKAMNSRQDVNKPISTYVEEAKIRYEVLKSVGGESHSKQLIEYTLKRRFKDSLVKHTYDTYRALDETDRVRKEIEMAADNIMIAYIIIEGSNDKAHRNLRMTLQDQYIRNHDDYPTTPTEAAELLIQYQVKHTKNPRPTKPHDTPTPKRDDDANGSDRNSDATQLVTDGNANGATSEEEKNNDEQLHVMTNGEDRSVEFCFYSHGIITTKDTDIDPTVMTDANVRTTLWNSTYKPKRETTYFKAHGCCSGMNERMTNTNMNTSYLFAQKQGGMINRNWILLDSQATCNVMCNEELVTGIRDHPDGQQLTIHCNAGQAVVKKVANLPGFGQVWFHPTGIANCLSLAKVSDTYRITLDTGVTQAFYVHKQDGSTRRFDRMECGLYACDVTKTDGILLAITTVDGQKKKYSDLDVRRATAARKLQDTIGYPSVHEFIKMVDNNLISNCAVTRRDIKIAEDIFGMNVNVFKGKAVREQPGHTREDISDVPRHILKTYGEVTLSIDIFHVNGIKFFRSISRHLHFRMTTAIRDAKKGTLLECLRKTIGLYSTRGFTVKQIHGDNEFQCVSTDISEQFNAVFHPVARGAHEPFIERDNRTSKERCRCTFNALPFDRIPARMIIEMVVGIDFWLNSWCSKGGVLHNVPPRQIITGLRLDANIHCKFQFGDYILPHNGTDNTMKPRANDAIYLRPTGSAAGGFYVFDLTTARRVHRRSGRLAHMTNSIIDTVHRIAKNEGSPVGLVFGDSLNRSTILDFETDSPPSDDDASDTSYNPDDDDDQSTGTELTGTLSEGSNESLELPPGMVYAPGTPDGYEADTGNENMDTMRETVHDHIRNQGMEPMGNNLNEERENELIENENNAPDPPTEDNQNAEASIVDGTDEQTPEPGTTTHQTHNIGERKSRRLQALPPIQMEQPIHPELREHNNPPNMGINLFTAGFSKAVAKLEREHQGFVLVAAAVQQFNEAESSQVTPQYHVSKGLKIFGKKGEDAVMKELKQLHDLNVISPRMPETMTREEVKRALPYLMFLKRKRSGKIKGRGCADGRTQREFISKDEASSPTVNLHALFLTCIIDAIEGRDVATVDIPGAFLQTEMPDDEPAVHIKLTGQMVKLLYKLDPERYGPCIIKTKTGGKVLYTKANKAIYGTLKAALLFWKRLSAQFKEWEFVANPYDNCTVNKMINGSQATIVWHVDDLKISHSDPAVVTSIIKDIAQEFGKQAPLTIRRKRIHEYLGMTISFIKDKKVKFTMYDYLEDIIAGLPNKLQSNRTMVTPAAHHLFTVNDSAEKLNEADSATFHHYVAKLLFAAKRARPDLQTAVAFLCTRVKAPDIDDWKKLIRLLGYLKETLFLPLILGSDDTGTIYWYVDASFAVHHNMRSHTGGMMTFGTGAAISMSTKQKINTKSSTEAELVGVDDTLPFNIWCLYFLREQGYHSANCEKTPDKSRELKFLGHRNLLYQDNTSSMRLEVNGKASSSKRTRHINIRYFMITDKISKQEVEVEYCPTEDMLADYFTKPLQGALFRRFRNAIMGLSDADYLSYKESYKADKRAQQSASDSL